MKIIRWFAGLVVILAFLYMNFFYLEIELIVRLINVILFCSLFVLFRVIVGPSPADRIVAVDILGVLIIGLLALTSLWNDQSFFLDVGLIWALMSFIASLAFSKILEGRPLDD
ncbi:MAG: multiple resistance and pH regulation protein F [Candidatus Marinimicrobia bacterium]|nr:multiple resistance and pH regulation protein F [Candidatus Neomarinimicrobiota bacterium]